MTGVSEALTAPDALTALNPSYMSPGATLWREIDALGGGSSGHSDFMRGWDAGHGEALTKVIAILERRGFTEHGEAISATDNRAPVEDGWRDEADAPVGEIVDVWIEGSAPRRMPFAIKSEDGQWSYSTDRDGWRRLHFAPVTHWRPLPAAPTPPTGSRETEDRRDDHRGWQIEYSPPPIPCRDFDYTATHPDFEGDGDGRQVWSATIQGIVAEIDGWYEEQEPLS